MDTLKVLGYMKWLNFVCMLFLVYKTLVQGRLASYMDTTKGALWSKGGFLDQVKKNIA